MTSRRTSESGPPDYRSAENDSRRGAFYKQPAVGALIDAMNDALAPLEVALTPGAETPPTVFLFGLPRAGTTLCQQVLSYCLDVGYVNNVAARFWKAPVHGIAVALDLAAQEAAPARPSFDSVYGKTSGLRGVHEFSYFWHDVLRMRTAADLRRFGRPNAIDWADARRRVSLIAQTFGKPTVFKTSFAVHFLDDFAEHMPSPLFVYVRRDLADVAVSILRARIAYYGDPEVWWSMYPPDEVPAGAGVPEQIALQVVGLDRYYREAVADVAPELLVETSYEEIAAAPAQILDEVAGRLASLYGVSVPRVVEPPESFPLRRNESVTEAEAEVVAAVERLARTPA